MSDFDEDKIAKAYADELDSSDFEEKSDGDTNIFVLLLNIFSTISKILFLIGEFYVCIIILNIIFELVIIYLTSTISTNSLIVKILHYIFSILLGYFSIFPLTFVFWEFFNFNWISELNPFQTCFDLLTVYSFSSTFLKKTNECLNPIFSSYGNFLFLIYLLFIIIVSFINNCCYEVILFYGIVALNILKYILIFAIYLIHCLAFIYNIYIVDLLNIILEFLKKISYFKEKLPDNISECHNIINKDYQINDPFTLSILYSIYIKLNIKEKKEKENKKGVYIFCLRTYFLANPINLYLMYKSNPNYLKQIFKIEEKVKDNKYTPIIYFKITLIIFISIYSIFFENMLGVFFIFICVLSFPVQIVPYSHHIFYKTFCSKESQDKENDKIYESINKRFVGFKCINYICSFLLFTLIIILTIISSLVNIKGEFSDINETFNKTGLFNSKKFNSKKIDNNKFLKSAMCLTEFHNLNLIRIAVLSQITYYDDVEQIKYYLEKTLFNYKDNLRISDMQIIGKNDGILVMTDIDIKNKNGVRVFSIRGTKAFKDTLLDVEMFASSATLSLIRLFPLIGNTESYISRKISEYLTIPIRHLKTYTLTNHYMEELSKNYEKFSDTERNIIFTGHSLGGGLAKYMGIKYNKQSISFSGPGVTPLEYEYSKNTNNNYIKNYFVDVIPDKDIVPRFETTSGTTYRVICEKPFFSFKCHSIDRTFCMIGLMCHEEEYTGEICKGIFNDGEQTNMMNILNDNL